MRLYEIDSECIELLERAQNFDEETSPDVVDEWLAGFEEMKGERSKKLEAIFYLMKEEESSEKIIQLEIDRLSEKLKSRKKKSERFKDMIEQSMLNANEDKVETALFSAKFMNNPVKLEILDDKCLEGIDNDIKMINSKLSRVKTKLSEKKKEIKEKLKKGEGVEGAKLTQSKRLSIK